MTSAKSTGKRPNIILLMADDQGWGDVGYNGHKHLKTPHLDQMADDGLRFDRFYSAAPVCSPTRGSVLTGRHPYRYGIFTANVGHMKPQEITLAELLRDAGYVTGHFGKWHVGTLSKTVVESNRGGPKGAAHFSPPRDNGFAVNFSTEAKVPTWDPMWRPKGVNRRTWWNPVSSEDQTEPYGTHYWSAGKLVEDNLRGDDSRVVMDRVVPFIQKVAGDKTPFFTIVWFHSSHLPVVAGPKYSAMYSKHDRYTQHYYGCITAMDEQIGRLRATLAELGIADNTMLWYCADNGPEGNDSAPGRTGGLRGRKRSLYEGGVRVPGLLVWPNHVKAGLRTSMPCVTSDYLPTVLGCLQLAMRDDRPLDGVSLKPLLEGRMQMRQRPIGFESGRMATWVDDRFKLVASISQSRDRKSDSTLGTLGKFEIYDIVDDAGETKDVTAEHPEVVRRMSEALSAWRESCRRSVGGADYSG